MARTGGASYVIMTSWGCEVHLTQAGAGSWRVPAENNPFGVFIRTPEVEAIAVARFRRPIQTQLPEPRLDRKGAEHENLGHADRDMFWWMTKPEWPPENPSPVPMTTRGLRTRIRKNERAQASDFPPNSK